MNRYLGSLAVTFLLVAGAATAGLTAKPPAPLSLDEAVRIALRANPELLATQAALDAGRWETRRAWLGFAPGGAFTTSVTRVDDESLERANQAVDGIQAMLDAMGVPPGTVEMDPFLYRDTYRSSFAFTQQFPLNLNLIGALKLARAGERAARDGLVADRERVVLETRQAYLDLLRARDLLAVARNGRDSAVDRLAIAKEKSDLGLISHAEVLRWETTLSESRSLVAAAEMGARLAEMNLNLLLARALTTPLTLVAVSESSFELGMDLAARSPEDLANQVLGESPMAGAIRSGNEAAGAGRLLALSAMTPSLHFQFNVGWRDNDTFELDEERTWSATALVNVPILDLGRAWAGYRKAGADKRRSDYESTRALEQLRLGVHAAWHEAARARDNLAHRESAARQAEATLNEMQDRREIGHITEYDLVDVQTAWQAARAQEVSARYQYFTALATLEQLASGGKGAENQ